jgi:hypothetical protein
VALLIPASFTGLIIDHLALQSVAFAPAQVHPEQHFGPVLGIGAPGAGVDGDDRIPGVILTTKQHLSLAFVDQPGENGKARTKFVGRAFILDCKIEENLDVVDEPRQPLSGIDRPLEFGALLERFLRLLLIAPEIRG